jgi:hypothetical protein
VRRLVAFKETSLQSTFVLSKLVNHESKITKGAYWRVFEETNRNYILIITEFSKLLIFKMFNKLYFHSLEVLYSRHDVTVNADDENRTKYIKYVLANEGSLLHQLMERPT